MFWIILAAAVILIILAKRGVFRKDGKCECCGKELKGTEQQIFGDTVTFALCQDCAGKIHPQIMSYAKKNWTYTDYENYLRWENETKEERAAFQPNIKYGSFDGLKIDTENGLFSIGSGKKGGLVLRFDDLSGYDLDFKPEKVKEGVLSDKVQGNETISVEMRIPNVYLEEVLKPGVKLGLKKKGIISPKYEYQLSDSFSDAIRVFTASAYLAEARRNRRTEQAEPASVGEVEKALALFMFDSMDEVTEESLKKQRNALIKTFHPDNNEPNEAYSKKINAAYELLHNLKKDG